MMISVGNAHGVDESALLHDTGITGESLADGAMRLWPAQEYAVVRNLLAHLGDRPGLGAQTAWRATLGMAGLPGLAALSSPTAGAVLQFAIRYQVLVPVSARYSLEDEGESRIAVVVDGAGIPEDVREFCLERDVALIFLVGAVLGVEIPALEIALEMPAERGRALAQFEPFDRHPMLAGQSRTRVVIARSMMDQPMPQADPQTAALVERKLAEALRRSLGAGRGLTAAVRDRLLRDSGAIPAMADVAEELHVTVRTLHRQLAAEGASFRGLLNGVRETKAAELLAGDSTVEEIARLLGYAETANFTHAFTRWRGMSPRAFRHSILRQQ